MSEKMNKRRDKLAEEYYQKWTCGDKPSFRDGFDAAVAEMSAEVALLKEAFEFSQSNLRAALEAEKQRSAKLVENLGMIDSVGMPAPYDKIVREAIAEYKKEVK